jgi:hypothetical protein
MKKTATALGVALGLLTTSFAMAEETTGGAPADGPRFRFGISGGAGPLIVSGGGQSVTLVYGGIDMRLGAQINDLIAVYAQPQLGFYGGDFGGTTGIGGLVGISVLADFTLSDQFFVGVGGGFGVLNNPSGPELHFRGGFYPIVTHVEGKARRKGLMLGADLRFHFLDGATGVAPTFSIGYEAF